MGTNTVKYVHIMSVVGVSMISVVLGRIGDIQRERERERQTDRQRQTKRNRQRDRQRQADRKKNLEVMWVM